MRTEDERSSVGGNRQDEHLERMCVCSGDAEWGGVVVMNLVDVHIGPASVQPSMQKVLEHVLDDKES